MSISLSADETVTAFAGRVNLLLLIPHGRAGSFFLQSLFDSHEEVIAFPSYFADYGWSLPDPTNRAALESFADRFREEHPDFFDSSRSYINDLDWVSPALLGDNQDEQFLVDFSRFRALFLEALDELQQGRPLSNRLILIALHFALAKVLNRRIFRIKYILFHQHGGRTYHPHVDRLLGDFPNLFFLAAVRDMRESWASFKSLLTKRWGRQNFFNFFLHYLRLNVSLYNELLDYYPFFRARHVKIVDLHRLHLLQEEGMRAIAEWLGIEPLPILSQSTFLGKKWWGNAADGRSLNGFSSAKAAYTWKNKLDPVEIEIVEFFSFYLFPIFGQESPVSRASALRVYRKLLLGPPLLNWPRRGSLMRKNVEMRPGFAVHPALKRFPLYSRRIARFFYNACYFALMSFAFFLRRYSWNDLKFFEKKRSRAVPVLRYEKPDKAACL